MANVTIPNLPSASNIVPSTDLLILEQTNGTRKATIDQIFVNANLPTITYSTWQGYTDEQKGDYVGYISGVPDEILNASSIAYDGTTSGSSNTNVQDELDKINANLMAYTDHGVVVGTSTSPMTSTVDGWFCLEARSASGVFVEIKDGDYTMWKGYLYSDGTQVSDSPLLMAKAGHTYSFSVLDGTLYAGVFKAYR